MMRVLFLLILGVWLVAVPAGCSNKGPQYMIQDNRDPMTKGVVDFTENDIDRLIYP